MLAAGLTLKEVLIAEDDPALLEFKCRQTNIPVWPAIRNQFFRLIISDLLFSTSLVELKRGARFRGNAVAASLSIAKSMIHNVSRRRSMHGDVLLTTVGAGLIEKNGA